MQGSGAHRCPLGSCASAADGAENASGSKPISPACSDALNHRARGPADLTVFESDHGRTGKGAEELAGAEEEIRIAGLAKTLVPCANVS